MNPSSDPLTAGYIDIDNSKIYFEDLGNGPPFTLVHDGLIDCRIWNAQFEHFAGQYRMVRYDRRGYGRSDPPQANYSNSSDLHTLLSFLGIEKTILMGCSAGGMVAIDFALASPGRVAGLVLVGPAVSGFEYSEHFLKRLEAGFRPLVEDNNVEQTIDNWANDPRLIHPDNNAAQDKFRELLQTSPHNFFAPHQHNAVESGPSAVGRLGEISTPTLILLGEADDPDNHAAAGALQVGVRGAQRCVLANTGHLPNIERPQDFNQAVGEFLATLTPE